jgi:hypothetical protein
VCINQYRQRTQGEAGLLREWMAGLPQGAQIQAAAATRLRAMARAMDPHPRRTARRADETAVGVRLRVFGLVDTRAQAAHLAAAKHLLETYLRRRLLIESTEDVASNAATCSVARWVQRPRAGDHA